MDWAVESRILVAYGLLIGIALVGGVVGIVVARRRAARKRRLRGIKSYNRAVRNRSEAGVS